MRKEGLGPSRPRPGSRFRKPSLKRPSAPPTSGAARISRVCGGNGEDMSRRKKVKFADSATFHEPSCNQETASLQAQGTFSSTCNEAKTSEYKFLQKLREETACKLYSCLPKQSCNTIAFGTGRNAKELNNSIQSNCETSCSIFPIENVTPVTQRCSLLPGKVSQNSVGSVLPIQNITPMSGRCFLPIPEVPWNADYENGRGLFTKKRVKILQLAAETLSLKLDDFVSNRSGLIATLLERLRAGQNLSSLDELPGPEPEKSNGIVYLDGSSNSDGNYTERTENSENIEEGPELFVASDSAVPWEMDQLPLTLYTAPAPGGFLDPIKGYQLTNSHEKRSILDSPPASCNMIMGRDTCHQSLDRLLSTARPALELEWKNSPIHNDWQNCLSLHTENQFHEKIKSSLNCNNLMPLDESHGHYNSPSMLQDEYHFYLDGCLSTSRPDFEWSRTGSDWQYPNLQFFKKTKGMLNYVYGGNRYNSYIGEQSLLKFQGQSSSCPIDFSSPGLRFSLGSERNIFSPIPDGLSWLPGID